MCVIPVNFSTIEKRNMLANLKDLTDSNVVVLSLERHFVDKSTSLILIAHVSTALVPLLANTNR